MAFELRVSSAAIQDLDEFHAYVSKDSPQRASKWLSGAWSVIFDLAANPRSYPLLPENDEMGVELRNAHYHSHRIVFRVREDHQTIFVMRVYHSSRKQLKVEELPLDG
ncbi:MAG: type II toxin-antitoxin system RelE/ParE family toxin [Fimbriimonas sp.]